MGVVFLFTLLAVLLSRSVQVDMVELEEKPDEQGGGSSSSAGAMNGKQEKLARKDGGQVHTA